jgi:DDE superfamily endonuclease
MCRKGRVGAAADTTRWCISFARGALYLPQDWARDRKRRRKVGVPEEITFKTKPEIALAQIRWACEAGLPRGAVVGQNRYPVTHNAAITQAKMATTTLPAKTSGTSRPHSHLDQGASWIAPYRRFEVSVIGGRLEAIESPSRAVSRGRSAAMISSDSREQSLGMLVVAGNHQNVNDGYRKSA